MSEAHDRSGGQERAVPAPGPHDPRLDAGGEGHPGVEPLPFDLVALENTRLGLRILGLGFGLVAIGVPLAIASESSELRWVPFTGWALAALGFFSVVLALSIAAPTPHGPLPKPAGILGAALFTIAMASSIVHGLVAIRPGSLGSLPVGIERIFDGAAHVALLALTWILWRFCQHRGLTGRATVWLWIAMASSALALGLAFSAAAWLSLAYSALGLIAFLAAQHTARDVWLDAIYRNTKFHATSRSDAVVEPLHPANER